MVEVVWTEPALGDLDAIADFISLDDPAAASRLVQKVFGHVEMLSMHPDLGPRIPELRPRSLYRQIVEHPCRVFYRHDSIKKQVLILGVMRGERHFKKDLLAKRDRKKSGPVRPVD